MSLDVSINVVGADARALMRRLAAAPAVLAGARRRGFARIKQLALREAKDNCPISPSKAQYEANLKAGWRPKTIGGVKEWGKRVGAIEAAAKARLRFSRDGKPITGTSTLRSKRTDFTPGSLTKSIESQSDADMAEIYVPSNSLGGKYAYYIEEQGPHGEGKWRERGLGTVRKGERAGDKFMSRAVEENREAFAAILLQELERAVGGLNR